jgi:spore germination protein
MQIYVVERGDSLWRISQLYGVPWQQIAELNGLREPYSLIIGQTVLIPTGNTYTVQSGDSFYSIARRLGISVRELQEANPDVDEVLYPGLILNIPEREKPTIMVNGFVEPSDQYVDNVRAAANALSYIAVFSYEVTEGGDLSPLDDESMLQVIKEQGVRPLITITNIEDGEEFSTELATAILQSEAVQNRLITNLLEVMEAKGYVGVNVDFEYLGSENREAYNQFLRRLTPRLHEEDYVVTTALAPKLRTDQPGVLYEGHDYEAHGEIVDYVILMTYEWGWSGGPPLPVSPLTQVRRVIDYALTVIPKEKIVMGINLYGYDWTLPYEEGEDFAKALSPVQATRLALARNAAIQYDEEEEAPFFNYWDQNGQEHIVWFEDLRSMQAKFNLVAELGLGGISFWNLAFSYPPIWSLILDRFNVKFK